jgi:nicotinate-nucleotide adenylyltransferase
MTQARRVGILGGTFDPIHRGHLDMGTAAEEALGLTRMFVIPSNIPPHRPHPSASAYHRFAMVSLAVAGRRGWRASDLELRAELPSYTADTLRRFHERGYAPAELFFVLGADAFVEIGTWKEYPRILDAAHFAVVSRPGWPVDELPWRLPAVASRMVRRPLGPLSQLDASIILIDAVTADVSATAIRQNRLQNLSIGGMVELSVQQHIEQHGLYTSSVPGRRASDQMPSPAAGRMHGQG